MKYVITPFNLISDGDMGANITSEAINTYFVDNLGLQVVWENNSQTAASKVIQDLTYTANSAGTNGNLISVEYIDPGSASQALAVNLVANAITVSLGTSAAVAASKAIQDLTYTADTAGDAGNDISVQYLNPLTPGTALSAVLNGTDIVVTLGTSYDTAASLVLQDVTYTAKEVGTSGNGITIEYTDPAAPSTAASLSVVDNAISIVLETSAYPAATATLNLNTDVVLTSVATGPSRNNTTFDLIVDAAAANPTNTVLATLTGNANAIICTITPNDGTNNGAVPVDMTTAELVELINTNAVSGKVVTVTDASSLRALQTATGGDATALANSGEGDGVTATFSGGDYSLVTTAQDVVDLINGSTAAKDLVDVYVSGTAANAQTNVVATNLAGGGFSSVNSTAAQIKTLLDGIAGVAALVNITVTGTGTNVQVPQDATNLENGSDYNFSSNANAVKIALEADANIANLVNIVISGVDSDIQDVQAETFLTGGQDGAVMGTISVEGSNDYDPRLETGTFYDLTFDPVLAQPNNNSSGYLISLDDYSFKFIRVKYTRTSGDGVLNVIASGKSN